MKKAHISKRVNIAVNEELHSKAKILSVLKGITLHEFISNAIDESVKKDNKLLKELMKD